MAASGVAVYRLDDIDTFWSSSPKLSLAVAQRNLGAPVIRDGRAVRNAVAGCRCPKGGPRTPDEFGRQRGGIVRSSFVRRAP